MNVDSGHLSSDSNSRYTVIVTIIIVNIIKRIHQDKRNKKIGVTGKGNTRTNGQIIGSNNKIIVPICVMAHIRIKPMSILTASLYESLVTEYIIVVANKTDKTVKIQ